MASTYNITVKVVKLRRMKDVLPAKGHWLCKYSFKLKCNDCRTTQDRDYDKHDEIKLKCKRCQKKGTMMLHEKMDEEEAEVFDEEGQSEIVMKIDVEGFTLLQKVGLNLITFKSQVQTKRDSSKWVKRKFELDGGKYMENSSTDSDGRKSGWEDVAPGPYSDIPSINMTATAAPAVD